MDENKIINLLMELSDKAESNNDIPVGCIITKGNIIISKSYNQKVKNNDPIAHAEILAIKKACKKLKTNNLNDCVLYTSLYPCDMCKEVINEVRIKNVKYILEKEKQINKTINYEKMFVKDQIFTDFKRKIQNFFKQKR